MERESNIKEIPLQIGAIQLSSSNGNIMHAGFSAKIFKNGKNGNVCTKNTVVVTVNHIKQCWSAVFTILKRSYFGIYWFADLKLL